MRTRYLICVVGHVVFCKKISLDTQFRARGFWEFRVCRPIHHLFPKLYKVHSVTSKENEAKNDGLENISFRKLLFHMRSPSFHLTVFSANVKGCFMLVAITLDHHRFIVFCILRAALDYGVDVSCFLLSHVISEASFCSAS